MANVRQATEIDSVDPPQTLARWRAQESDVRKRLAERTGYAIRCEPSAVSLVGVEGVLVHGGRQVATAEGRFVGPDMKLYARATTTCLILDRRRSAASPA